MTRRSPPFRKNRDDPQWGVAQEYTDEERREFLRVLKPQTALFRQKNPIVKRIRLSWIVAFLLWPFFVYLLRSHLLLSKEDAFPLIGGYLAMLFVTQIGAALWEGSIRCPACHHELTPRSALYCPVCGGQFFHDKTLPPTTGRCEKCSKCYWTWSDTMSSMSIRNYRNWRVKFCAHCGVQIDEEGV
jgi:hypothetical protein